jgi:hypothetical protein
VEQRNGLCWIEREITMTTTCGKIRALSLLSGGLDSQLAVCVLRDQGIEVHGLTFESPFFNAVRARKAADSLKVPLHVVDFTEEIVGLLAHSKHGYGAGMNPCIDCHALMIRKAGAMAREMGFNFVSTGEVLNQRPMSQNRQSLEVVARESGCADLLVRPLSGGLLAETEPERRGWVDRSRLLKIEGRNRKAQYKLAEKYGLKEIPQPAGGCKLTEPNFCRRLKDLKDHEGLGDIGAIKLLCAGRHFRLGDKVKLIVGRDEKENALLEKSAGPSGIVVAVDEPVPGPTCLLPGSSDEDQVRLAAAICAAYSDNPSGGPVRIWIRSSSGTRAMDAVPALRDDVERLRV